MGVINKDNYPDTMQT